MGLTSEAEALAGLALLDFQRRGQLSLQCMLRVQLASRDVLFRLRRIIMGPSLDFYNPTPLQLTMIINEALSKDWMRFNLMCELGMTREIQQLPQLPLKMALETGMGRAIRRGQLETVKLLATYGTRNLIGLRIAAEEGRWRILKWLLVNQPPTQQELTEALSAAIEANHRKTAMFLLGRGAQPIFIELWLAVKNGQFEISRAILRRLKPELPVPAEVKNSLSLVLAVLPRPELHWSQGDIILRAAAQRGDFETFSIAFSYWVMEHGYQITLWRDIGIGGNIDIWKLNSTREAVGVRALTSAAGAGRLKMVRFLLPLSNLLLNVEAVEMAASRGHVRIVRLLLSKIPTGKNICPGILALEIACKRGYLEVVRLLIPRMNSASTLKYGLDKAAKYGHLEIVRLLLEAGVPPTSRAIDKARVYYPEVVTLLESYQS